MTSFHFARTMNEIGVKTPPWVAKNYVFISKFGLVVNSFFLAAGKSPPHLSKLLFSVGFLQTLSPVCMNTMSTAIYPGRSVRAT